MAHHCLERDRTWRSARGWRAYLASALPCVGASCLEWWAYEGIILLAGWLPSPAAAVAVMCARASELVLSSHGYF